MNKKFLFALAFLLAFGSAFAVDANEFVRYYSNSVESHSCLPSSPLCAYTNVFLVPSYVYSACSAPGAQRVLGLSGATNAHAEVNTFSNYSGFDACLKSGILTPAVNSSLSDNCYYTSSNSCDANYVCQFGLSATSNAHLSQCGVFGASEVKLCCKFAQPVSQPGSCDLNLSIPDNDLNLGDNVSFVYSCLQGAKDANLVIQNPQKNIFLTGASQCSPALKTADVNSFDLNMGGLTSKIFTATLTTSNSSCSSSQLYFRVTQPGAVPVDWPIPSEGCDISSFKADSINASENPSVSFSCANDGTEAYLLFFDGQGNALNGSTAIRVDCSKAESVYDSFVLPQGFKQGLYLARLYVQGCRKDSYFSVSESKSASIPDSNAAAAVVVLVAVVALISFSKKSRK